MFKQHLRGREKGKAKLKMKICMVMEEIGSNRRKAKASNDRLTYPDPRLTKRGRWMPLREKKGSETRQLNCLQAKKGAHQKLATLVP